MHNSHQETIQQNQKKKFRVGIALCWPSNISFDSARSKHGAAGAEKSTQRNVWRDIRRRFDWDCFSGLQNRGGGDSAFKPVKFEGGKPKVTPKVTPKVDVKDEITDHDDAPLSPVRKRKIVKKKLTPQKQPKISESIKLKNEFKTEGPNEKKSTHKRKAVVKKAVAKRKKVISIFWSNRFDCWSCWFFYL